MFVWNINYNDLFCFLIFDENFRGIEDIEVDNSLDPIIEDDLDDLKASSSKILLSDQLKCYIKDSKNVNKFSFIKGYFWNNHYNQIFIFFCRKC